MTNGNEKASPRRPQRTRRKRYSFTARDAKGAEEEEKLYREGRKTAKEQKSFDAKELTIKSETNPEAAKDCAKGGIWACCQNMNPQ